MSWVHRSTDAAPETRITCSAASTARSSRWESNSSRMSTSGEWMVAARRATRVFSPPESVWIGRCMRCTIPARSRASSTFREISLQGRRENRNGDAISSDTREKRMFRSGYSFTKPIRHPPGLLPLICRAPFSGFRTPASTLEEGCFSAAVWSNQRGMTRGDDKFRNTEGAEDKIPDHNHAPDSSCSPVSLTLSRRSAISQTAYPFTRSPGMKGITPNRKAAAGEIPVEVVSHHIPQRRMTPSPSTSPSTLAPCFPALKKKSCDQCARDEAKDIPSGRSKQDPKARAPAMKNGDAKDTHHHV